MGKRKLSLESTRRPPFGASVFINCPFDSEYWSIFEAIVFCIVDCGFVPRSALELTDSGEVRVHKLRDLIRGCKYAIHDLSRIELSQNTGLPRFNMPFELGLDLGARFYGPKSLREKRCLILEGQQYTNQKAISDIAGQDPRYHNNSPTDAIREVRNWLQGVSGRKTVPGPATITTRFADFSSVIPQAATAAGLDRKNLTFIDYVHMVEEWLRTPAP